MLPPKLMHILGGLAFSEFFSVKKVALPWSNHILKLQWEIHFLIFFNTDRNAPKQIFRIEIMTFSFQICFKNQFLTSGSRQTENTRLRVYALYCSAVQCSAV